MKGKLLVFGVSLLAVATLGVVQLQTKAVDSSRDCDRFAIIRCGALNGEELRKEYETNNASPANGDTTAQGDIRKVFTAMGIAKDQLSGFKAGVVYKDGTVKVDGKVVATDAMMAARGLGGTQIAGTNAQKVSVGAMSDAQTAMVKLDANGKFLFAIMKPCGNPVTAKPKEVTPPPAPEPTAECKRLTVAKKENEPTAYLATATAATTGKATIKSYTFQLFHDGRQVIDRTIDSTATSQSLVLAPLTAPGAYQAKVIVGTSEGNRKGPQCEATFTIEQQPPAPTPAVTIEKFVDNDKKYARVNANVEFSYRIVVTNTGNTDLDNVVVTDTPDRAITLISVSPPSGKIANNTFSYTIPKLLKGEARTFALTAKVPVAQAGRLVNTVCVDAPSVPGNPDKCDKAEVEVPPTPVPGKIEVCVINEKTVRMVTEADVNANPTLYTKDLTQCDEEEVPAELPQTGPVETALSVVGAMSLVGASAYYVASRRHA